MNMTERDLSDGPQRQPLCQLEKFALLTPHTSDCLSKKKEVDDTRDTSTVLLVGNLIAELPCVNTHRFFFDIYPPTVTKIIEKEDLSDLSWQDGGADASIVPPPDFYLVQYHPQMKKPSNAHQTFAML